MTNLNHTACSQTPAVVLRNAQPWTICWLVDGTVATHKHLEDRANGFHLVNSFSMAPSAYAPQIGWFPMVPYSKNDRNGPPRYLRMPEGIYGPAIYALPAVCCSRMLTKMSRYVCTQTGAASDDDPSLQLGTARTSHIVRQKTGILRARFSE